MTMRHAGFFAAVILFAGAAAFLRVGASHELSVYDWFMRHRPEPYLQDKTVLIEISDDSIREIGSWPIPRSYHAALVDALTAHGARAIVFDILFPESTDDDEDFARAMRAAGMVYLPVAFRLDGKEAGSGSQRADGEGLLAGLAAPLREAAAGFGHVNVLVDDDGKVRRIPGPLASEGTVILPLGAAAAQADVRAGYPEAAWINFPGAWRSTFTHLSYLDVLKSHASEMHGGNIGIDLGAVKGKICFVGLTAVGTSDIRATPVGVNYPLLGVHASVCESLLHGRTIRRVSWGARAVVTMLAAGLALWFCASFSPVISLGILTLLAGAVFLTAGILFAARGIFLDVAAPVAATACVYVGVLLQRFLAELARRKILERELELAASIQKSFLPSDLGRFAQLDIAARLKPAKYVAGDFYDIIVFDEQTLGVFIGDVSGKGVSASLIMAQAISLLRVIAQRVRDPAGVLAQLNDQLSKILKGRFITGQFVVLDARAGTWEGACAGHAPALLVTPQPAKPAGITARLAPSGPPLGLMEGMRYSVESGRLERQERLILFTDGWTESRDRKNREFGTERLGQVFGAMRGEPVSQSVEKAFAELDHFTGATVLHDDLTLVMLEYAPRPESGGV